MVKKKQVPVIVGIVLVSFLIGTMFNVTAMDGGRNPFDRIWETIYNLQGRVENIEKSIGVMPHVEFLRVEGMNYFWGVEPMHWNVSKLQTKPIIERMNSTLGGIIEYMGTSGFNPFDPVNRGYGDGAYIGVTRELTETEIENIGSILKEYLPMS